MRSTGLPHTLFALWLSRGSPDSLYRLPSHSQQVSPKSFCNVPAQPYTGLQEWRLTWNGDACIDKDLGVSDPAPLVSVEPLGFFGRRILNEAL